MLFRLVGGTPEAPLVAPEHQAGVLESVRRVSVRQEETQSHPTRKPCTTDKGLTSHLFISLDWLPTGRQSPAPVLQRHYSRQLVIHNLQPAASHGREHLSTHKATTHLHRSILAPSVHVKAKREKPLPISRAAVATYR